MIRCIDCGTCAIMAGKQSRCLGAKTLQELHDDRMLQLALVQLIEIIGEAASRVPDEIRSRYPSIPWQLAADMRHKLIHGYDVIEYAIVFDTVRIDVPPLVGKLDEILATLPRKSI
jgi:uncharacterized protein with HEPN domain